MIQETAAAKVPAKRGRKPETTAQRVDRLERELQAAKHAVKQNERRMFEVVGAAVLAEADTDEMLKQRLVGILRERVTTAVGRANIARLLV